MRSEINSEKGKVLKPVKDRMARTENEIERCEGEIERLNRDLVAASTNGEGTKIAELSRRHNDANVLVLPARFVTEEEGVEIMRTWLETPFDGGRHGRRVDKIEPKDPAC